MVTTRGTTNGNVRGSSYTRRRRREWLLEHYRADVDVDLRGLGIALGMGAPACRCYRCGRLLAQDALTVDRIIPGCQGGTYRRTNIRPACGPCNSETGGATRRRVAA